MEKGDKSNILPLTTMNVNVARIQIVIGIYVTRYLEDVEPWPEYFGHPRRYSCFLSRAFYS
jgi:hypothetical protein